LISGPPVSLCVADCETGGRVTPLGADAETIGQ
jgi:hypothetical protein